MINLRLARNSEGCPCIKSGRKNLHIAMIFEESGANIIPYSYGQNWSNYNIYYHAEHHSITKLKNRDTKKLLPINIFVLKTTLSGTIGCSLPCAHCIALLCTLPNKKGYRVVNVYYTNSDKEIEKKKLSELLIENPYVSRYHSNRNYKPRLCVL
jgi:cytidine deaminase